MPFAHTTLPRWRALLEIFSKICMPSFGISLHAKRRLFGFSQGGARSTSGKQRRVAPCVRSADGARPQPVDDGTALNGHEQASSRHPRSSAPTLDNRPGPTRDTRGSLSERGFRPPQGPGYQAHRGYTVSDDPQRGECPWPSLEACGGLEGARGVAKEPGMTRVDSRPPRLRSDADLLN